MPIGSSRFVRSLACFVRCILRHWMHTLSWIMKSTCKVPLEQKFGKRVSASACQPYFTCCDGFNERPGVNRCLFKEISETCPDMVFCCQCGIMLTFTVLYTRHSQHGSVHGDPVARVKCLSVLYECIALNLGPSDARQHSEPELLGKSTRSAASIPSLAHDRFAVHDFRIHRSPHRGRTRPVDRTLQVQSRDL